MGLATMFFVDTDNYIVENYRADHNYIVFSDL